ncbi:MAG: DNA-directed RNA polymerase subunit alpha [Chloroflexi bacterium]|nr:DNA-directed RNA polymerase subunit alpha [Chloroflexota bacterium]
MATAFDDAVSTRLRGGDLSVETLIPKIESTVSAEGYGRFSIGPLESGFGVTLGNALRRVLLSSLSGAAVTSVKIEEVQHEFSSIPHVKEDTTEFLLNVKQLRIRSFSDRPGKLSIEARGEGSVTAADIKAPADFEVVNPELHLATLDSPEASLTVELSVERGKSYIPASQRDGQPIGMIPVDAIFTPIRKASYSVEKMRIGQVTTFERLNIEIWTDGTITPVEALSESARILVNHFAMVGELGKATPRVERQALVPTAIPSKVYDVPIEDLDLSVRAYNCLKRSGISKVGQVLEMSEEDLLSVRNFGRKSLEELRERLVSRGFMSATGEVPGGGEIGSALVAHEDEDEDEEFESEYDYDEEEEEQE